MKRELLALEARKAELAVVLEHAPAPAPRLHPKLTEIYRTKVVNLQDELDRPELRAESAAAIRSRSGSARGTTASRSSSRVISRAIAAGKKKPVPEGDGLPVTLVAGRGFEPLTFRL